MLESKKSFKGTGEAQPPVFHDAYPDVLATGVCAKFRVRVYEKSAEGCMTKWKTNTCHTLWNVPGYLEGVDLI